MKQGGMLGGILRGVARKERSCRLMIPCFPFRIDEEEKWPLLLGNVKNLFVDNEALETEVLANASAVHAYQSKKYITQMTELSGGVSSLLVKMH
ncbi:hypothetical protein [Sporolactobacillus putidus]|nr:hypothetical protein [Sporolactobacillus putidus]